MEVSLLLMILFTSIPVKSRAEEDKAFAKWSSSRCVRRQNPQFSADYNIFSNRKYVDSIKVNFDGLYTTSRCNRDNELTPDISIRREENKDWEQVKRGYGYQIFGNLNPCSIYRVHIADSSIQDLTVGPYYNDTRLVKPVIGQINTEYENSLTRATITVTPKNTSASIKLSPICAKTVQLEIVPENNKTSKNTELVHIDPSRMEDIELLADELQPCTRYVVDLALSLETQNETELEEDNDVYRKSEITTFSTLPNLEDLKNPGMYDNSSHFLSLDKSWEFLEQECAKPIFDQNPQFTLTISNQLRNVPKVRYDLTWFALFTSFCWMKKYHIGQFLIVII